MSSNHDRSVAQLKIAGFSTLQCFMTAILEIALVFLQGYYLVRVEEDPGDPHFWYYMASAFVSINILFNVTIVSIAFIGAISYCCCDGEIQTFASDRNEANWLRFYLVTSLTDSFIKIILGAAFLRLYIEEVPASFSVGLRAELFIIIFCLLMFKIFYQLIFLGCAYGVPCCCCSNDNCTPSPEKKTTSHQSQSGTRMQTIRHSSRPGEV